MVPLAIGLGLIAINAGNRWIDRQVEDRVREAAARTPAQAVAAPSFATVVVAKSRLTFGAEVSANALREIPWAAGDLPRGGFAHVSDVVSRDKRFVVAAIEEGEPVLASKITGPGQRADLAAVLSPGMKAATIRVDEVVGVAGFVLPGDRVDVLLTRVPDKGAAYSDVIMQNVKVLAVDQLNDDHASKPAVARSVTLEVATEEAQRLIVAQNVGAMTLVLRPFGDAAAERGRRVTAADLVAGKPDRGDDPPTASFAANVTVGVIRGADRKEYTVPPEARD
jgi:pilus assembly protein CpaB